MTISPLKKLVLAPVLVSATLFSVLTVPLALLGSKPVVIQLQEEPVFYGKLRDVATPYLGLATVLSLGAGIATASLTGWRQSSRKSAAVEEQLSGLQQHLKEKEELIEELRFSDSHLEASGLKSFLNDEISANQVVPAAPVTHSTNIAQPIVSRNSVQVLEKVVVVSQAPEVESVQSRQVTAKSATSMFPTSQTFLGYTQTSSTVKKAAATVEVEVDEIKQKPAVPSQVEQIQSQLQQLMSQIQSLQSSLQTQPEFEVENQVNYNYALPSHNQQLQVLKSRSKQKIA